MGKTLGYGEITVANMTEPFTVMLTNEAQQFATDSNRKVTSAQSYYTDIIVIRGSQERTDYTIGNITSGSGITVSNSSKRVTFSVSAGGVIGADTGVIEIPITLDGQTVKKQFSWSCGKQGPQGVKGDPGTSVKITSKSVTYQTSTSGTTTPTGTWSTTVPMVNNGQYLWTKTTVQYSDGNKTEAYSVSYKGTNGTNGTSVTVSKTEVTYQVSTSGTTAPTGTWSTTMPSCDQGQYLWTKTYVKYSDGKDTTSYSVSYKGVDGEKFSWNLFTCSTLTDGDQENKANWARSGINNWSVIGYSDEGLHFTTNSEGVADSNGVSFCINRKVYNLQTGDTVTFSVDIKGTIGTGKPLVQYWSSTPTDNNYWARRVFGDSLKTVQKDTYTRYKVTVTLQDVNSSVTTISDYFCIGGAYNADLYVKNIKLEYGDTATPWAPHPEDLEGRGVSQTVQYYLATSQASGVTSSTSGWSTDITTQKLTADKKYLWNCYQTKYSDGTSEPISTPKVIGVYGDKGNGIVASVQRPNKTEFWWSQVGAVSHKDTFDDSSNTRNNCRVGDIFTVMGTSTEGNSHTVYYKSTTDSGDLAGECINHVVAESGADAKNLTITPSSQYFKSTDGGKTFAPNTITIKPTIQGEISFGKWQYSIDGGVSFADVVSGQKGLTVSNNVLTVSKDSSLYSDAVTMITFRAVADDSSFYDTCSIAKIYDVSDIGDGRNLWITRDNITLQACEKDKYIYTTTGTSSVCIGADGSSVGTNTIALQTGTKYTISFVISSPSDVGDVMWYFCTALNGTGVKNYGGYAVKLVADENIVSQTITVDTSCDAAGFVIYNLPTDCIIKDIQVEKGSSPTGWTPAPEDVQTAILSTKSEISDVSLKVDKNKQAIEKRVEKTTYEQDLNLVKGDINKANEGLNKWRYEIYPKSLFASEYQGKSTMDVFAKNTNLTPSQSVLINDTDLSIAWNYDNNYIGYALTFAKFSAAKSVAITFAHDDGAHIYLNGKLIGGSDAYNNKGESLTLGFVKGWNCIEVVVNEGANTEGFKLGTTISALSECQLMNCYYGTPVARQSHITNQLVENTTNIEGVTTTMQKVMTTVGGSDRIDEFVNNYNKTIESEKQFKKTIGETYTTKDEFNGLEIGGRNLVLDSKPQKQGSSYAVVSRHLSVDLQAGVTYTISFCGRVVDGDGSLVVYLYRNDWKDSIQKSTKSKENTVISWQFTPKINGAFQIEAYSFLSQGVAGGNVYLDWFKVEKGNKATDWTPAPEDNGINGQNLVSNLPANWEQGTFQDSKTNVGCDYNTNKASMTTRIRVKELVPVSGTITISNAYSNQSKKPIQNMITAFDVNKKWLGNSYVSTDWNDFPRIVDMKDAKYIAVVVRYKDESAITPSDISQICLKIERGTSATPFTLAPEDVNGKIVNVETIANQTAKKFEWIVKGESTSSNLVLTDNALTAIANNINLTGKVTFNSFDQSLKDTINNKTNVSYLNFSSDGNTKGFFKIATLQVKQNYANQNIIFGVNHREHGYTECRIKFSNSGNTDPGMGSFKQTGTPTRAWRIIKTATSTWDLYLAKTDSWDGGRVIKFDNPYGDGVLVTWSGASADLPDGAIIAEQMIADQTTIDGGIITTGYLSADRIAADSITADKIATDAIKSRNYISSGGTQGSFLNLSDGSFQSPNLSWDSNGNLIAKNANLSGYINATDGTVGGWNIAPRALYSGINKNAIEIYYASTYDAETMYKKQKAQNSFIVSQTYLNHFVSRQMSINTIPYWKTQSFTYNDSQINLADSKYCINTSSATDDATRYSLTESYIGSTRIYMEQNITQIGGGVIKTSFWMGLDSTMGWCTITSTNGVNIYGDSSKALCVQSSDTSKYNAIETVGDVVVSGKIHAVSGNNKIQLNSDNNGSIELYGDTPFIDFHHGYSDADYTSRIIANSSGELTVCGNLRSDSNIIANNDLYANSWVYAGWGAHFTWQSMTDAYISCGNYNNTNNVYYYAGYHAFYVNNDSGSGMMYINTNGVTSRVGFTKTSDERIKKNFKSFDDNIIDAYMNIEPVKYQLKQSSNDNYHFGFRAQHVDKVFSDYGDTYNESFDICTSRPIDPDKAKELYGVDDMTEEYGLRYDELIAPTTYMVQHIYKELESTKGELAKVKQEKADLETRLQAIEAKLRL